MTADKRTKWWLLGLVAVSALATAWLIVPGATPSLSPNVLPRPLVLSPRTSGSSSARCAECHSEITSRFAQAPHALTLHRASDEAARRCLVGQTYRHPQSGVEYHYAWENEQLVLTTPAYDRPVVIDWIFGSGTHARTPVMTSPTLEGGTQAIEHAVSCYPTGLGPTVGQEQLTASSGLTVLGQDRPPHEAINCFGCHSTHVATEGDRILFDRIQPGVGCQRCHWNSDQHAAAMERGEPGVLLEDWTTMTAAESVDHCGECHRRADEMEGPIEPTDPLLPRFASVGLVQSRCFTEQASLNSAGGPALRLDCLTCHDPHAPHESRAEVSRQACANCHDTKRGRATECPTSPRDADCLTCHMPTVPANDQLRFTDHWIRVGDVARTLASESGDQKSPPPPKSPPPKSPPP